MVRNPEVALAMDWGGTWCRIAVINRSGDILWQSRVRNGPGAGQRELLDNGFSLVGEAEEWCVPNITVAGLGIAIAGPIDADTGTLLEPPNLPALDGVSLLEEWQGRLSFPVYAGNDANLAALGEFEYGAGLEARQRGLPCTCLVYVTVSTGIGGGVVERGRMILGARGMATEVGHMVLDRSPDAPLCQCGRRGCLEALASGTSIARIARYRVASTAPEVSARALSDSAPGEVTGLSVLAGLEVSQITAEQVFEAARDGDALASEILDEVLDSLSTGLSSLLHLYNPDLLVMGGGVSFGLVKMGLLPRIEEQVKLRAMSDGHRDFRLVSSRLGDTPGMMGAASLVWTGAG